MPLPTPTFPTPTAPIIQIVEFHSVGDVGWSEVYFMQVALGLTPLLAALERHKTIIQIQKIALPVEHVIEGMRVTDVSVLGDSKLRFRPEYNLGAGQIIGDVTNPALGYFMVTSDDTGTVTTTRIYRGWTDGDVRFSADSPRTTIPVPRANTMLQAIGNELVTGRATLGSTTTYLMRSFVRPNPPAEPVLVTQMQVQIGEDNSLVFLIDGIAPATWVRGKYIKVLSARYPCVRGVAGRHLIASVTLTDGISFVQTTTKYNCAAATLVPVTVQGYLETVGYYNITDIAMFFYALLNKLNRFLILMFVNS